MPAWTASLALARASAWICNCGEAFHTFSTASMNRVASAETKISCSAPVAVFGCGNTNGFKTGVFATT